MSNPNSKDERRIVEEKPTMKSVSMMSAPAPIPLRMAMPPPAKFGAVPAKPSPSFLLRSQFASQPAKPSPENSRWRVTVPLTKPSYYHLERTHKTIDGVTSLEISRRIDECLRKASIDATFDDKEAVAKANSCQCLKFAIRLWKAKEGVTVEIQRTKGCSFLFQQLVKKVFHAASAGSELYEKDVLPSAFRSVPPIPQADWEASATEDVTLAAESLKQDTVDAHILALQSLADLSKSPNCKNLCMSLVLSEESAILDSLVSLVVSSSVAPGKELSQATEALKDDGAAMRRNAMHVLSNCLLEASTAGNLDEVLSRFPQLTSSAILGALVDDVDHASSRPHCAAAACRCLQVLCMDASVRSLVAEGKSSISLAAECHHQTLREESSKLLRVL